MRGGRDTSGGVRRACGSGMYDNLIRATWAMLGVKAVKLCLCGFKREKNNKSRIICMRSAGRREGGG